MKKSNFRTALKQKQIMNTSFIISFLMLLTTGLSAQKVGIGSVQFVPVSTLDVKGGVTIGANYAGVNASTVNGLLVEGNVGVGTTTPATKLGIVGDNESVSVALSAGGWNYSGTAPIGAKFGT